MNTFDYNNGLIGTISNKQEIDKSIAGNGGKSQEIYQYKLTLNDTEAEEVVELEVEIKFEKYYEIHDIKKTDPLWHTRGNLSEILEKLSYSEKYSRTIISDIPKIQSSKIKDRLKYFPQNSENFSSGIIDINGLYF